MARPRDHGKPMISLYQIKPRFQALLRPLVAKLAAVGFTANGVTLATMSVSCLLGALLGLAGDPRLFLLLPLWMFLRMTLNAIDGMLAREFGQRSPLGAYLNELTDVVSDAVLYLPFVAVAPFGWASVGLVIFASALSEMAGVLGPLVGAGRHYEGPMGKSDRALLFGTLGMWLGLAGELPAWSLWILPLATAAIGLNIVNRIRGGLTEISPNC